MLLSCPYVVINVLLLTATDQFTNLCTTVKDAF